MFDGAPDAGLVETGAPRVTLRNAFQHPFDSAIAAARTCYSSHLITHEEITDKQRLNIGAATFYSGHHTVYQHAHFEFGLENVSRQFVWSFLHAHPFYNSEQQSQRYVRLDRAQAYVPPVSLFFDEASRNIYENALARAWARYRELSALLTPDARNILSDIWHIGPMSHPSAFRKLSVPRKNAPSKSPVMSSRSLLSPPWSTPCRASSCIACGECVPPPTRPAKRAPSSAIWSRKCVNSIPNFSTVLASLRSKSCPNGKMLRLQNPKLTASPVISTPNSAAGPLVSWIIHRTRR